MADFVRQITRGAGILATSDTQCDIPAFACPVAFGLVGALFGDTGIWAGVALGIVVGVAAWCWTCIEVSRDVTDGQIS